MTTQTLAGIAIPILLVIAVWVSVLAQAYAQQIRWLQRQAYETETLARLALQFDDEASFR